MRLRLVAVSAVLLASTSAFASPAPTVIPSALNVSRVYSPTEVGAGEMLTTYSGVQYNNASGTGQNNTQYHTLEAQYGYTDSFSVGVIADAARYGADTNIGTDQKSFAGAGYGLEAQYKLTCQKNYWLNSAVRGGFLLPMHDDTANVGVVGLLASRQEGPVTVTGNIGVIREFGADRTGGYDVATALQGVYAVNKYANPGLQYFADWGTTSDLGVNGDRKGQYAGPIVTGDIAQIGNGSLKYLAGYELGLTRSAADNAATVNLSYAIKL